MYIIPICIPRSRVRPLHVRRQSLGHCRARLSHASGKNATSGGCASRAGRTCHPAERRLPARTRGHQQRFVFRAGRQRNYVNCKLIYYCLVLQP